MKGWVDQILGLLAATATALLLGLIARNDMGSLRATTFHPQRGVGKRCEVTTKS
jgi:hypothetical protein